MNSCQQSPGLPKRLEDERRGSLACLELSEPGAGYFLPRGGIARRPVDGVPPSTELLSGAHWQPACLRRRPEQAPATLLKAAQPGEKATQPEDEATSAGV